MAIVTFVMYAGLYGTKSYTVEALERVVLFQEMIMQDGLRPICQAELGDFCFDFLARNPAASATYVIILAAIIIGISILVKYKVRSSKSRGKSTV